MRSRTCSKTCDKRGRAPLPLLDHVARSRNVLLFLSSHNCLVYPGSRRRLGITYFIRTSKAYSETAVRFFLLYPTRCVQSVGATRKRPPQRSKTAKVFGFI